MSILPRLPPHPSEGALWGDTEPRDGAQSSALSSSKESLALGSSLTFDTTELKKWVMQAQAGRPQPLDMQAKHCQHLLSGAPGNANRAGSSQAVPSHAHASQLMLTHSHLQVPEQGPRKRPALWEGPAGSRGTQEGQSVDTPEAHLSAVQGPEH